MDFFENVALKPKFETQDAHFSGKQYTLHCMILEPPNPYKFIYHLCDSTIHDSAMVDIILRDIFILQNINDETVITKSDNCQDEYKCVHSFGSYQNIANDCNVKIIRAYGAAGHSRGQIDAMSSFGCKNILRKYIIGKDIYFRNSDDIAPYLTSIGDKRMLYRVIKEKDIFPAKQSLINTGISIHPCQKMYLFVFTPGKSQQLVREYLGKCEPCINLDFENCIHHNNSGETSQDNDIDFDIDCCIGVDEDVETVAKKDHLYDFIDVPSFVTVFSSHSAHELFYLFKITKKLVAENNKEDIYGHKIFKGERYYLEQEILLGKSK